MGSSTSKKDEFYSEPIKSHAGGPILHKGEFIVSPNQEQDAQVVTVSNTANVLSFTGDDINKMQSG